MDTCITKEKIEVEINKKRALMIDSARINGYTNEKTLRYSQELDVLIYQYLVFFRKKEYVSGSTYYKNCKIICQNQRILA